jgi:hypothetical protein
MEEKSMESKVSLMAVYVPSEDIVAREIEGELIIVPLVSGIADIEDDLFTLNETGRAAWDMLDGVRKLEDVVNALSTEYDASEGEIEKDLVGLTEELLKRRIIVEVSGT